MKGRKLNALEAKASLRKKGCKEEVLHLTPLKTALIISPQAMKNMGIKSWGLVDYLRDEIKMPVILVAKEARRSL